MKRYKYYQPNDKDLKDKYGDCQIRAISKALNLTWLQTFDLIIPICRDSQTMTPFSGTCVAGKQNLTKLGFEYHGISNKRGTKRPTVTTFAKDHPTGTFILKISHHVVACVDGIYYDTWDCGEFSLYGYYELIK